ncbi:ribosomal protein L7Ae/L30e/S12e/Gadd45 family [Eubacterium sp. CAG:786]|nr:ribosomal protein L7Ae/L30e/S12e/Gadd45 family [Eubacterium sp. CAG:786]
MGFDAAVQEMTAPKSKAAGIILAADVSPKTEKEICFHAEKCGTPVVHGDFTMDDAKDAVGKRTGIFLVLDAGLYGSITKHISGSRD